jgi:hypothetical protein
MFTPFAFIKSAAPAGPVLWTPAQITTLAWYDASNASNITLNGSNVSQMIDLSGNGYNATQSTSANQPLYSGSINGLNTITFNPSGTNEKLDLPSINIPANRQTSAYFVFQQTGRLALFAVAMSMWKSGNTAIAYLGNNYLGAYINDSYFSTFPTSTNPVMFGLITTSASSPYLVFDANGTLYNSPGPQPNWDSSVFSSGYIGNDQYGSAFQGLWGEAVIVPQYDSPAEREKMEGYLMWKWGLQANLPITSPYYNAPPYV